MKAITIKEPWATLICLNDGTGTLKNVENRVWSTRYRGKVLIHTSAKTEYTNLEEFLTPEQLKAIKNKGQDFYNKVKESVKHGSRIIGEVEIVDCVKDYPSIWSAEGQYQFVLKNAKLYDEPIEDVRGSLMIWNYNM
jgi:hypothetical protein